MNYGSAASDKALGQMEAKRAQESTWSDLELTIFTNTFF